LFVQHARHRGSSSGWMGLLVEDAEQALDRLAIASGAAPSGQAASAAGFRE